MKKLLIADYLAENLINRVFDLPKLYSGTEVLLAVYGYAFQPLLRDCQSSGNYGDKTVRRAVMASV